MRCGRGPLHGRTRYEEVDERGETRLGEPINDEDAGWLAEWWPITVEGERAEIGGPRDAMWRNLTRRLTRGTVLAVDDGHLKDHRPEAGTMTGFKAGRETPPIPDGTRGITAHVAVDAIGAITLNPSGKPVRLWTTRPCHRCRWHSKTRSRTPRRWREPAPRQDSWTRRVWSPLVAPDLLLILEQLSRAIHRWCPQQPAHQRIFVVAGQTRSRST